MSITMPGPHPLVGTELTFCGNPARILSVLGHGETAEIRLHVEGEAGPVVVSWNDPRTEYPTPAPRRENGNGSVRRLQPYASVLVKRYGAEAARVTGVPKIEQYAEGSTEREMPGDFERLVLSINRMVRARASANTTTTTPEATP